MNFKNSVQTLLYGLFALCLFVSFSWGASGSGFEPLTDEELSLDAPKVDPEADAEYLYLSTSVDDSSAGSDRIWRYSRKLKIFTEQGVKDLNVFTLQYTKGYSWIKDFSARVTNPDGTVIELGKRDLHDKTVFETNGDEVNSKSFSFPQLQVGSIIEYKWELKIGLNGLRSDIRYLLRSNYPIQTLRYEVRPSKYLGSSFAAFNYELEFEKTEDSRFVVVAENLQKDVDEPYAPSDFDVKPWLYLKYVSDNDLLKTAGFWEKQGEYLWNWTESYIKPKQRPVAKLAKELFVGLSDSEEKLKAAFRYCTEEVENYHSARAGYTDEEREKLKDVDSPGETIKRGYGSGWDINSLFGSLAAAAGFEVRYAACSESDGMRFNPAVRNRRMNFPEIVIALRKKEEDPWRFFDVGYDYLPFEILDADNMGAQTLVGDKREFLLENTQKTTAEANLTDYKARLQLSADGTLSGKVTIEYGGAHGVRIKRYYDELSDSEKEERYVELLEKRFSKVEVTDFTMENIFTRGEPVIVRYTIEVPEYGERLGKRIFVQPNIFDFGKDPLFKAEERTLPVRFEYPWTSRREVWIEFPAGFEPEEATSPGQPFKYDYMSFYSSYGLNKSRSKMRLKSEFKIRQLEYRMEDYSVIKTLFDEVNRQNTYAMTLIMKEVEK